LILSKVDYKSEETISILGYVYNPIQFPKLIVDQAKKDRFLIYTPTSFTIGSLDGDKIVLDPPQELDIGVFKCSTLIDNQIHGICFTVRNSVSNWNVQYSKIDLIGLTKETVTVPFVLNDGRVISKFEVDILFLFLNKFRIIHIAGLERGCILSLVIKIVGYFNNLV
jgi:hypothetical protein